MNIIEKAMENLPGRWSQGKYNDGNGNSCGLGHVLKVSINETGQSWSKESEDAFTIMNSVAQEQYGTVGFAQFNDLPDTTEDKVLAIMEKAAIKFDEQV